MEVNLHKSSLHEIRKGYELKYEDMSLSVRSTIDETEYYCSKGNRYYKLKFCDDARIKKLLSNKYKEFLAANRQ